MALTKKELAALAGYSYRRLHDIDAALDRDHKLFVRSEEDDKKYRCDLFVQRWVAYNKAESMVESEELSVVKAQHEKVKKEKTEIEVARMKGEFVAIQDVYRLWANIANIVKNRFVTMPRKLAPMLVLQEDAERIEEIIDRDVRDALNMIAKAPMPGEEGAEVYTNDGGDEE